MTYLLVIMILMIIGAVIVVWPTRKHHHQDSVAVRREADKLARIRAERAARMAQYGGSLYNSNPEVKVVESVATTYKKINRQHHKAPHGELLKEEVSALRGNKRLVDRAGGTSTMKSLYESNKWENPSKESHYNVREYKINNRNARREKRAYKETIYQDAMSWQ